ncbi:TIM barrel protein [Kamptonema cortianum]|nr:TIM barrel protein [Oscillatoria laete-virens]MDK3157892.1 TIM barrel protein [Kamptonema cortianum]MDL5046022.1 TIM barrel protein [Oscillatoria amoena NRMC-F 0135]MDL5052729.1 TIM barrel protein [Oscillatoria laete-virens NRMC-F 0139]
MLEQIKDLGFDAVELGHGTKLSLVEGILRAHKRGLIRIRSLHNFCPLPAGVEEAAPNYFLFSSRSPAERASAIRQTRQTIDFAKRLGAEAVVLHLGLVPMKDHTDKLVELHKQQKKNSKRYAAIKLKAVMEREKRAGLAWNLMLQTLEPIVVYATQQGILLGVETRYLYEEIPTERELPRLFERFEGSSLRYWHDTGHAQSRDYLGFVRHADLLELTDQWRAGWHIHDVIKPDKDHQPIGAGEIDFRMLAPYLAKDAIRVLELSPRTRSEDVIKSREALEKLIAPATQS